MSESFDKLPSYPVTKLYSEKELMKNERLQFFLSRIGKRVYRNDDGCDCNICKNVTENGLIVENELHANYLYDNECDYKRDGTPLRYFDTPGEVENWLKTLPLCLNTEEKK